MVTKAPEDEDFNAFSQPLQASFFHIEARPGFSSALVRSAMAVLRSPDFNAAANFSMKTTRYHPHKHNIPRAYHKEVGTKNY